MLWKDSIIITTAEVTEMVAFLLPQNGKERFYVCKVRQAP